MQTSGGIHQIDKLCFVYHKCINNALAGKVIGCFEGPGCVQWNMGLISQVEQVKVEYCGSMLRSPAA